MIRLLSHSIIFLTSLSLAAASLAADKPLIKIQHWHTQKGIPVYFVESHEVSMVDTLVSFYAGSAYDGKQPGLAALTNSMLVAGTQQHDANSIAEQFAAVGAQFNNTINKDFAVLSLRVMSKQTYLTPALKIFTELLQQPSFPAQEVARQRNELLAVLQYQQQSPATIASQTFEQVLYQNHPYAHPTLGKPETVRHLSAQDLAQFYKQYYVAENANIIIVGAQTLAQAKILAEQISQSLTQGAKAAPLPKPSPITKTQLKKLSFPAEQTHIIIGQANAIDYTNPAFIPLDVGNYIFGGQGLSSLLFQQIRKNKGLTYGAYSQFNPRLAVGNFKISLATRNQQALLATTATQQLLKDYLKQGPSKEQVAFAKQFLLGNLALQFANNTEIANALLKLAVYQLPTNFYDTYQTSVTAVNQQAIHQAWQRYIHPEQLLIVQVGQHAT